jgi:hypothetical protein
MAAEKLEAEFLEILACPECKAPVEQEEDRLVCTACGKRYPVREGIPIMLVEEAEPPAPGWQPRERR